MHDITPIPPNGRRRFQFRLRTLVLIMLALSVSLALVAAKFRQDQNHALAWRGLQRIGVNYSIRSLSGHRIVAELVSTRSDFSDGDVDSLLAHVKTLGRARDLGLTRGAEIGLIDVTNSQLSETAIARLRAALPNAEIRH